MTQKHRIYSDLIPTNDKQSFVEVAMSDSYVYDRINLRCLGHAVPLH